MTKMKFRSRRRGQTLVEMVLAISLAAMVSIVGLSTFLVGMASWYRGETRIECEQPAQQSVRNISMTLRTAMSVTVDANGKGLSYRLPKADATGTFISPPTWDGINRRIELDGSNLVVKADNAPNQTICENVITTDPLSSTNAAYQIFTPGQGAITRSLTVMVVSEQSSDTSPVPLYGRHRETIYFRNVPQLNQ